MYIRIPLTMHLLLPHRLLLPVLRAADRLPQTELPPL